VKLTSTKLRCCVPPPQHAMASQSTLTDVFSAPEYSIEPYAGAWLRITHVESGKSRLYPIALSMGADVAEQEQPQQPLHGRRR
jgi:hypothetical protein